MASVIIKVIRLNLAKRQKWKVPRLRDLRKLCTDIGVRCKQKISFLTPLPPYDIAAPPASILLRFVMILAQVNLFYAVTPDRD